MESATLIPEPLRLPGACHSANRRHPTAGRRALPSSHKKPERLRSETPGWFPSGLDVRPVVAESAIRIALMTAPEWAAFAFHAHHRDLVDLADRGLHSL